MQLDCTPGIIARLDADPPRSVRPRGPVPGGPQNGRFPGLVRPCLAGQSLHAHAARHARPPPHSPEQLPAHAQASAQGKSAGIEKSKKIDDTLPRRSGSHPNYLSKKSEKKVIVGEDSKKMDSATGKKKKSFMHFITPSSTPTRRSPEVSPSRSLQTHSIESGRAAHLCDNDPDDSLLILLPSDGENERGRDKKRNKDKCSW